MQNNIYLTDTYRYEIQTTVLEKGQDDEGQWVALRDNIFHPQGGGQPADAGWINDQPVRIKKHPNGWIIAYLAPDQNLNVGDAVSAKIDKVQRQYHAALHTTGHLLSWEMACFGWKGQKGHHFPNESRVEFSAISDNPTPIEQLDEREIEALVNQRLYSDYPVSVEQRGELRLCRVSEGDEVPCGGTHVDSLGKICQFVIKSMKYKKGILRISYDAKHVEV
ncbi:hypothetical protein NNF59_003310 [Providencia stuartii]|uniref:hypothetical protein n=1 Tax=Providencia TaxID=586 RepID=UPI000EF91103|nr:MULTISPECIES: hypothetical protein [Providencia]EMF0919128.1 hypothetical protein [Providencia stuartii]MCR4080337.1 hypothetical protein [Providencia stuartii]MTC19737.1 hypothetical protein [Providencia stuartii]RMA13535.1 hypothetical protein EA147_10250 [Providencia stuartii]